MVSFKYTWYNDIYGVVAALSHGGGRWRQPERARRVALAGALWRARVGNAVLERPALSADRPLARRRLLCPNSQASKRMPGDVSEAAVRDGVERLEQILPGVLNLYRMKARDWVSINFSPS